MAVIIWTNSVENEEAEKEKPSGIITQQASGPIRALELLITLMTKLTFVVDLSVPVDVCFPDHLVYFLVCQLLSQVSHHMTQLCCTDVAISILTKRWGKVIRPTRVPFQCFSAYLLWICEAGGQIQKKIPFYSSPHPPTRSTLD